MKKIYRIGIIGCGHIAEKMAVTLAKMEGVQPYAVAARDIEKSEAFALKWGFEKHYGSYEELADDADVDLIYIATPHSHHYAHAKMCIEKGKPVLCEKSFTANAAQARSLISLARERKVFITEAIWTRYMPLSIKLQELIKGGAIGKPNMLTANLGYPISDKQRITSPELAGGALLDIGVYALNFAAMAFGSDIERTHSTCSKLPTGVDAQDSITLFYKDGKVASIATTIFALTDRSGMIASDKGFIVVENINNPQSIKVYDEQYNLTAEYKAPEQITGFEYQVAASVEALENGWLESPYMPHNETIRVMEQMDSLRKEWGVVYPWD